MEELQVVATAYFNNWVLQGSNNGSTFTTLYTSTAVINNTLQEFILSPIPTTAYIYYRIYVNSCASGNNPGLSWFQIFTVDSLF